MSLTFTREELGEELWTALKALPREAVIKHLSLLTPTAKAPGLKEKTNNEAKNEAKNETKEDAQSDGIASLDTLGPLLEPPKPRPVEFRASAEIGKSGEAYVRGLLSEYEVVDTHTESHTGDLHVRRRRQHGSGYLRLMLEIKNYANSVPNTEVEKFMRDLSVLPDIHGALFISLRSRIQGHASFEFLQVQAGREIPVLFLTGHQPELILAGVGMLFSHLDQLAAIYEQVSDFQEHEYPKIWREASRAVEVVRGISRSRLMLTELRAELSQRIDRIQETILINEGALRESLERIQRRIAKLMPSALTGEEVDTFHLWGYITKALAQHPKNLCLNKYPANAAAVDEQLRDLGLYDENMVKVRIHGDIVVAGDFQLHLYATRTDICWPPREEPIVLEPNQTYNGTHLMISLGRHGEILNPRAKKLPTAT